MVALLAAATTALAACSSAATADTPAAAATTVTVTETLPAETSTVTETAEPAMDHDMDVPAGARNTSEVALYEAMRSLWDEHMEWTYATIASFAAGSDGFNDTVARLLQNQTDIGNAIKPYYGDAAGDQLSDLLHKHIEGYVPVLQAAAAGDADAAGTAFEAVLANGVTIGEFLEAANPEAWGTQDMVGMMNTHNNQTLQYASDQLTGNFADSIALYGEAEAHMREMADMLSAGIVSQFPDKFTS